MKSHDIDKFIPTFESLVLKVNKGERHRIMHVSIKNGEGSLWFQPYSDKYRLYPTGVVISHLAPILRSKFGEPNGKDMGRDYWYVSQLNAVKEVIVQFSKLKI